MRRKFQAKLFFCDQKRISITFRQTLGCGLGDTRGTGELTNQHARNAPCDEIISFLSSLFMIVTGSRVSGVFPAVDVSSSDLNESSQATFYVFYFENVRRIFVLNIAELCLTEFGNWNTPI